MKNIIAFIASLFLVSSAFAAPVTPNSFHFQAVPNASVTCSAASTVSTATFAAGAAANAPDVIIRNIGTTVAYFEITTIGGATASATTSQSINPGEADILSKYASDTISCITASGTSSLSATPGTGN